MLTPSRGKGLHRLAWAALLLFALGAGACGATETAAPARSAASPPATAGAAERAKPGPGRPAHPAPETSADRAEPAEAAPLLARAPAAWWLWLLALASGLGLLAWAWRSRAAGAEPGLGFHAGHARGGRESRGAHPPKRQLLRDYNPRNVGNDASARPWERSTLGFEPSRVDSEPPLPGSPVASSPADSPREAAAPAAGPLAGSDGPAAARDRAQPEHPGGSAPPVPQGFDAAAFLHISKAHFLSLQTAWDQGDLATVRAMMTPDMAAQLQPQIQQRAAELAARPTSPAARAGTEVAMLQAHLLSVDTTPEGWLASVEFSGLVRELPSSGPTPFREIWTIHCPHRDRSLWLVAGVQALQ